MSLGVYPFKRSPAQLLALREMCLLWRQGEDHFWDYDDVLEAVCRPGNITFYAATEADAHWQGLILSDVGPYSADLLYIYVRPESRRTGAGRLLLTKLCEELRAVSGIEALFLEVRASNQGAQELYRNLGMQQIGLRRSYYADGENALVFRLTFIGRNIT